jgi:hypothetical protein
MRELMTGALAFLAVCARTPQMLTARPGED